MSISAKIQEAREWGRCIEQLKASVDSMYEICRVQQNILGCEEAIMFLKNGIRDFLSLVDTIKIEQNWENSEKRPMTALAWEIRGTISKSTLAKELKEKQCQTPSKFNANEVPKEKEVPAENGIEWKVVQRKRGAGGHSKLAHGPVADQHDNLQENPSSKQSRKAPKSAMDLPQTKASMAKMAYSRQLLFEKHKKTLLEKFNARRRLEKHQEQQGKTKPMKEEAPEGRRRTPMLGEEERKSLEKDGQKMEDCLKSMLIDQLSDDCEWRAMTEEEESLAQEEASLKKEIQEEEEEGVLSPFEDDDIEEKEEGLGLNEKQRMTKAEVPVENAKRSEEAGEEGGGEVGQDQGAHYRKPGDLAQLRAKLLSPIKRRRTEDIDQSSENKLRRAEELRITLQQEKAQRLHLLHQRVEEVRGKREQIQQKKMAHLEMVKERIQKAEKNRQKSLEEIVQRAQEDEMKIMEINLLNSFEAANQRLGKRYTQIRERNRYEKMVRKTEEERQRKIEENRQQREEAEKRRKDAEEQRTQRLKDQASHHQERQSHALKHRTKTMEKYRAKVAQHSQKVFQRKSRELVDKQKLLDKIQRTHDKRTEIYEQCKEQVRRRANELSSPRPCHFWAQTLADFSQLPSDLVLQQRPAEQQREEEQLAETTTTTTATNCFRCGTRLTSDLNLLAHVMSEEHLARAGKKDNGTLHSSAICYDFLRNELEKMSTTANVEEVPSELNSELMTKSADSLSYGMPMERIICKNASMLLSDQTLLKLLMSNGGKGKAKASNNAKKKRTKMRQKFVRDFEWICPVGSTIVTKSSCKEILGHKSVETLLGKIAKCTEALESGGGGGGRGAEEMVAVERGLIELQKALQDSSAKAKQERAQIQRSVQESDLIGKLLALNILIKHNAQPKGRMTADGGPMTRIQLKSLRLLSSMIGPGDNSLLLGGTALLHLSDLFQLNASHAFIGASGDDPTHPADHPHPSASSSLPLALFILYQFGQLFPRISSHSAILLFSYLCSCCSLLEFISLVGRQFEFGDLLEPIHGDLSFCQEQQKISPCEVITSFIISLLGKIGRSKFVEVQREVQEEAQNLEDRMSRNNSVESQATTGGSHTSSAQTQQQQPDRLRLCAVLWMYCLTLHAYQHFHQLGSLINTSMDSSCSTLLPSSMPSSPSKTDPNSGPMSSIMANCLLRKFNAMAETNGDQQTVEEKRHQSLLQHFLHIEADRTMAIRVTGVLRSILQLALKGINQQEGGGTRSGQQQRMSATETVEICIRAIGHFAAADSRNQLLCLLGWHRSVLCLLCSPSLPLEFVHSAPSKHSLLPTLIILLRHSSLAVDQIRGEFCLHILIDYLKAEIQTKSSKDSPSEGFSFLELLEPRVDQWIAAKEFFESAAMNNSISSN